MPPSPTRQSRRKCRRVMRLQIDRFQVHRFVPLVLSRPRLCQPCSGWHVGLHATARGTLSSYEPLHLRARNSSRFSSTLLTTVQAARSADVQTFRHGAERDRWPAARRLFGSWPGTSARAWSYRATSRCSSRSSGRGPGRAGSRRPRARGWSPRLRGPCAAPAPGRPRRTPGSFSVTSACSGVFVRIRRIVQNSPLGASKVIMRRIRRGAPQGRVQTRADTCPRPRWSASRSSRRRPSSGPAWAAAAARAGRTSCGSTGR